LSDIDERNAQLFEQGLKSQADKAFEAMDVDKLTKIMYYCQESKLDTLDHYVRRKFSAITTYGEIEEKTKSYKESNENNEKNLKQFLTKIINFQYSNPTLDVSQYKNSIQLLYDGCLVDEKFKNTLEDLIDEPKYEFIKKFMDEYEISKKKFKNIPSKELSSLIDKISPLYTQMKEIFELDQKLKDSCEKKSISEIESLLEKVTHSSYSYLIEKQVLISKELLEDLMKREDIKIELYALIKTSTKENSNQLKKCLNDNRGMLSEQDFKIGSDHYLLLDETVSPNVETPPNVIIGPLEVEVSESINIQTLSKVEIQPEVNEEMERIKQEELKKKSDFETLKLEKQKRETRRKERKRKKQERENLINQEKEKKLKERDEKIKELEQKLKDAREKRKNAEKLQKEQEILVESEKFKRLNPKMKLHMKSAHELAKMDIGGLSDPYVIITLGTQSFKTPIIKKSIEPVWNQIYEFNARGYLQDTIQFEGNSKHPTQTSLRLEFINTR
jgi:hypothetical protein